MLFNGILLVQPNLEGQKTYMNPPYELVNQCRVERAIFSAQYGLAQGAFTYNMKTLHGVTFP